MYIVAGFKRGSTYENNVDDNIDYDSVSFEVNTDHIGATNEWARWIIKKKWCQSHALGDGGSSDA